MSDCACIVSESLVHSHAVSNHADAVNLAQPFEEVRQLPYHHRLASLVTCHNVVTILAHKDPTKSGRKLTNWSGEFLRTDCIFPCPQRQRRSFILPCFHQLYSRCDDQLGTTHPHTAARDRLPALNIAQHHLLPPAQDRDRLEAGSRRCWWLPGRRFLRLER